MSFLALVLIVYRRYGYLKTKKIFYCPAFKASIVRQGNGCGVRGCFFRTCSIKWWLKSFQGCHPTYTLSRPVLVTKSFSEGDYFFAPIPSSHSSFPQDGAARNYLSFYLHGFARSCNLLCLDPFIFPTSYVWGEKKTIWSELELNLGPFASQSIGRTTRPCLPQAS